MPVTRRNKKSEDEQPPSKEIDLTKIKDLIKLMEDHDLTAFELEDSGFKVRLEKGGTPEQVIAAAPPVAIEEKAPEKIVAEEKFNYIDAIVHYCEINSLEVDSVTKLISKPLKERLKWDAIRLNFMKKTSRAKLPL